jgi:hypothetical protein
LNCAQQLGCGPLGGPVRGGEHRRQSEHKESLR